MNGDEKQEDGSLIRRPNVTQNDWETHRRCGVNARGTSKEHGDKVIF